MYSGGSIQRQHHGYKKEGSTSPIVSLEGVILTAVIKTHALRHIACFGISDAFLHTQCKDKVIYILLKGKLVELTILAKPKLYHKQVQ